MNSRRNTNERSIVFLETNDNNWYKLCRNKIGWKQTDIDDYIKKDKESFKQIKFNILGVNKNGWESD